MQRKILSLIDALRQERVRVSPAETLDAMRAVGCIGIEPTAFREALAATLIKDESDRPTFDVAFERIFGLGEVRRRKRKGTRAAGDAGGGSGGDQGSGGRTSTKEPSEARTAATHVESEEAKDRRGAAGERLHAMARLAATRFEAMTPRQVDECPALAEALARRWRSRWQRRRRQHRRGRLDVRRTMRRSMSSGGVPLVPILRRRRPGCVDLVALCDVSHSVAHASQFLLSLLAPARSFFRHVHIFGFVDEPVPLSFESGRVIPHDRLDLYARSDFGRVLLQMEDRHAALWTRNTVVLILGDARNNRRSPRVDVLTRLRQRVKRLLWLNPESPSRWNTGDSVLASYAAACDAIFEAGTPKQLARAVERCSA